MTGIKVEFLSSLAAIAGRREMALSLPSNGPTTLRGVLGRVRDETGQEFEERVFSKAGELNSFVIILVNGEDTRKTGGLDTPLEGGEEIMLIPSIAGG